MKPDFCIIGSGIAGMSLAIRLSALGKVLLVSKSSLVSGSTPLAQGGIAGVVKRDNDPRKFSDSISSHFDDTMKAGRNANNPESVQVLVESAPWVLADLADWGIRFHQDRHLEGGHSHHRIFNTGDTTGLTIAEGLAKKIKEISEKTGKIEILEDTQLFEISGKNAVLYQEKTQKFLKIFPKKLFLASGGFTSLFANATTPEGNIGDATAVFLRAGGKTKNLYRIQFHPTALALPRTPKLLISEAVRGAGATIVFENGEELCEPLLPRDIVSQKVFEAEISGKQIFLDARKIRNFSELFPTIHAGLQEFGLDAQKDLLPITPAAHYCMGGIETDIFGRTNLPNVFALGECAEAGVHGKNRLASNSLLEGLVFAKQIFEFLKNPEISNNPVETRCTVSLQNEISEKKYIPSSSESKKLGKKMQEIASRYLGISRTEEGIKEGKKQVSEISDSLLGTREVNMKFLLTNVFNQV